MKTKNKLLLSGLRSCKAAFNINNKPHVKIYEYFITAMFSSDLLQTFGCYVSCMERREPFYHYI